MKIPDSVPHFVALEARGKNQVAITLEVERGWRFWLPRRVEWVLERDGGIWFYQTLHKLMQEHVQEKGWAPNYAAAINTLRLALTTSQLALSSGGEATSDLEMYITKALKQLGVEP